MAAKTKPQVRKTIRHNTDAPSAVQAAQIALVLMQVAKADSWASVLTSPDLASRVLLTDEQQALLEKHSGILPYLTRGGREGTLRSVVACPVCERVMFISTGTAPTKCQMKLGCEGVPVKARSTQERAPKGEDVTATEQPAAA